MVPEENAAEAAVIEVLSVILVRNLRAATSFPECMFRISTFNWLRWKYRWNVASNRVRSKLWTASAPEKLANGISISAQRECVIPN
jgi:hypothetical protein